MTWEEQSLKLPPVTFAGMAINGGTSGVAAAKRQQNDFCVTEGGNVGKSIFAPIARRKRRVNDMRLIDADEMAVQESEAYMRVNAREDVSPITQGINSVVHRKMQELIANTPTIDAVPVVRCQDCIHYKERNLFGRIVHECEEYEIDTGADGYCHKGVRREKGE